MFTWLKSLFTRKEPAGNLEIKPEAPKLLEKPCRTCGKPVFYDPSWQHIPNYCKECKRKFEEEKGLIGRKCKGCGKHFTFPKDLKHYPNYCRECRAKQKKQHGD